LVAPLAPLTPLLVCPVGEMLPALDIDSHADSGEGLGPGSDADIAALLLCWPEHRTLLGAMCEWQGASSDSTAVLDPWSRIQGQVYVEVGEGTPQTGQPIVVLVLVLMPATQWEQRIRGIMQWTKTV